MSRLSPLTNSLLDAYKDIESRQTDDLSAKLEVSQTVTFFGTLYEKMRNAVEYRESHLVRKATIERILRRRLLLNQRAEDFSETLVRELLWGKYLPENSISENIVDEIAKTAANYLNLRRRVTGQLDNINQMNEVSDWIVELLACKIEFILAPNPRNEAFTNFMYRWLRPTVAITDEKAETTEMLVYLAFQEAFNKTDEPLLRYHYLKLYGEEKLFADFWQTYSAVNECVRHPLRNKIAKLLRKQNAPFLILETLLNRQREKPLAEVLTDAKKLQEEITTICEYKYKHVNSRLRRAAVRSIIYLFLTKMLLAILLEVPIDRYLGGEVDTIPLAINISFPPLLMFIIALLITPPGKDNTKRIISRIEEILTQENSTMPKQTFARKSRVGKPLLTFIFTAIYTLTFLLIFGSIIWLLTRLGFNIVSQIIFIFFLTVVSFFAYRIKLIPREYRFAEKDGLFAPIIDFLLLPILSVGKWLSEEIGRINVITFIFDFILEAPFKAIFEVFEEWIGFLRTKREEIV